MRWADNGGGARMRASVAFSAGSKRAIGALTSIVVSLVVLLGLTTAGPAGATTVSVTGMAASASTPNAGLGGAVPTVLAAVGTPITLTVTLSPPGAAFTKNTSLGVTATLASGGRPHGAFSPSTLTFPAGATSAQFSVSYSAVDNGVIATVGPTKANPNTPTPGSTAPFDVLKVLRTFASGDPGLQTGLAVGNANCTAATSESECGTLFLSKGTNSPNGALSLGACTSDLGCTAGSEVVQVVADLGTLYSPQAPAQLIIRCVKSQCPGKGVNNYTIKASFAASGPLSTVLQPCASKGVALDAAGNQFCTDYVQSHRDNAGDVLLYVLFVQDFRGST